MLGNSVTENNPQSEDKLCLLKASLAIVNELTTSLTFFSFVCVYAEGVCVGGQVLCCARGGQKTAPGEGPCLPPYLRQGSCCCRCPPGSLGIKLPGVPTSPPTLHWMTDEHYCIWLYGLWGSLNVSTKCFTHCAISPAHVRNP